MSKPKVKIPISYKLVGLIGVILLSFGLFFLLAVVQIKNVDSSYNNLLTRRELVVENVQQLQLKMVNIENTVQHLLLE